MIRQHQDLVYGLAYSELGRFEDAQDVTQEVFIRAWTKLGQLRAPGQFKPWLRQLARNECRMFRRQARPTEPLVEETIAAGSSVSIEEMIAAEQALAGLGETNREAFILFTFHSLSLQEVGDFLGVPLSTVMSRLRNARAQLRKDMERKATQTINAHALPADFATRIPVAYDEYDRTAFAEQVPEPLSDFRRGWLLAGFPAGTEVSSYEELDRENTRVTLRLPDGGEVVANIRFAGRKGGIELEAALLPIFREAGIDVPRLFASPTVDPSAPDRGPMSANSNAAGTTSLIADCMDLQPKKINASIQTLFEWMDRMRAMTPEVLASPAAALIERATLLEEWQRTMEIGGPWMTDAKFKAAMERVRPFVEAVAPEVVFSSAGLLASALRLDDEGQVVGMTGLPWARLEDPHYEITKCWTYDMWPFIHAGIVERYLVRHGLTMKDLAPRLAVRALVTIQRELPLEGGDPWYRSWLFAWLGIALDNLELPKPFDYPGLRAPYS